MKHLSNFVTIVCILILLWLAVSFIDTNTHNLSDCHYAKWNIFEIMFGDESDYSFNQETTVYAYDYKPASRVHTVDIPVIRELGEFSLTAYCGCSYCCGKSDGITSTGARATANRTVAVDPSVIPYGSIVIINNKRYVAEDCGGGINGSHIDIYFDSHNDALDFGVQYANVYIEHTATIKLIENTNYINY